MLKGNSMRTIDDHLTSKLNGFDNVDHYYSSITFDKYFKNIKIPTLFISDAHDPVIGEVCIPDESKFLENENIALLKTHYGGHIGYFESIKG